VIANVELELGDLGDVFGVVQLVGGDVEEHALDLLHDRARAPERLEHGHRALRLARLERDSVEAAARSSARRARPRCR